MRYIKEDFLVGEKPILAHPDNYDTIARKIEKDSALAEDVDGRKIVKAGTVYKIDGVALGLVFNTIDVTDSDRNVAILIKGTVLVGNLPAIPTKEEADQMKNIVFLESLGKKVPTV